MNNFSIKLRITISIVILIFSTSIRLFSQCSEPTATGDSICGTGQLDLSVSGSTGNYKWYDAATGGSFLGEGSSFTTPTISSTTSFYVSEYSTGNTTDALSFDGTNDYVAIKGMYYATTSLSTLTVEAWVKTTVNSGNWNDNWSIVDFDRSEYYNVYITADNGYVGFSTTGGGATDDFYGVTAVNDGNWHHIAAVYDGTDKRIYVDGVLDATKANAHSGSDLGTGNTRYGFLGDGSEADTYNGSRNEIYYQGDIDEVRVWSDVRTATEISNNRNSCIATNSANLELYYQMNGSGSETTLIDYSGNGYDGTLVNMTLPGAWISTGSTLSSCMSCESDRDTAVAKIMLKPTPNLGNDSCIAGNSYTLDAGASYNSYKWNDNSTNQTLSITTTGTYWVEVDTTGSTCKASDTIHITLSKKPTANDTSVCGSGSYKISASGSSGLYKWYDVSSGGSLLGTGKTYTTSELSASKSYYVSAYDTISRKGALTLDGTDDYIAIESMHYATTTQAEMTVEAWIKTSDGGDQIIASFDRSEYWRFEINGTSAGTGQIGLGIHTNAAQVDLGGTGTINDGNWHHVAAVYDNGDIKLYIDGSLDASTTSGTAFGTGATAYGFVGVGSEATAYNGTTGPNYYFNGDIDEVRIWDVARTQSEIQASMNTCIESGSLGLQLYYPMDEGSGSSVSDYSLNSNDGNFQNMNATDAWDNAGHKTTNCECYCESDRDELVVTLNDVPKPNIGNDSCVNAEITLDASNNYTSYLWSTGATTQTIDVTSSGFYSVEVDSTGTPCKGTDGISLSILIEPEGTDTFRCGNGTLDLEVKNGTSSYYWYDHPTAGTLVGSGATFTTPSLSLTTSYYVSEIDNTPSNDALRMDGTDDQIAIHNMHYATTTQTELTVEAWIKTTDGTNQIIASFDRSEYWRLEINGDGGGTGQIGFDVYTDAGIIDFGSSSRVDDGNWHHIAAVYDNGDIYIYIDGTLDASTTKGNKIGKGTTRYGYIGNGSEAPSDGGTTGPDVYFNGDIDEVRIWNVARNISQIQSNKDDCLTGSETGLQLYYKMEDGSGSSTITDHSNNSNNGTLQNMNTSSAWINTGQDIDCSCGESSRDTVVASIEVVPTVNLGNDTCVGSAITLDAGSGFSSYLWKNGATTQTISAANSTEYWVKVDSNGTQCEGGDTIVVSVGSAAIPQATDSARCGTGSIVLKATSPEIIYWWDKSSGGTELGSGTSLNVGPLSSDSIFYMTSKSESKAALSFDGTNDYAAIQNKNYNTAGSISAITVEAWVNTTYSGSGYTDNWSIVDFDRSEYYNVYIHGDGRVGFSTTDNASTTDDFFGSGTVNDGNWHHIAVVYDGTDKKIYIDGSLDATSSNPHSGNNLGTGTTRYGFLGDGSEATAFNGGKNDVYYDGKMDEIRIWNVARTQTQINDNKSVCLVGNETGLELYYRMSDGSGSTITDFAGSNNATIYGATWINTGQSFSCSSCGESDRKAITATVHTAVDSVTTVVSWPGDQGSVVKLQAYGGTGKFDYEEMNDVFDYSGTYSSSTLEKTIPNGGSFNFKAKDENGCIDSIMSVTTSAKPSSISSSNYSSASYIVPQKNDWFYMKDGNSKAIIAVKSSGSYLGKVSAQVYVDANAGEYDGFAYMNRHFVVDVEHQPSSNVNVKLYFSDGDYNNLVSAANGNDEPDDDISGVGDLGVTKYEGPTEDGTYDPTDATSLKFISQDNNSTEFGGKYIQFTTNSFSELWVHSSKNGSALPVELISFDAYLLNNTVIIEWTTASELNNDYFTIQRSADGIKFEDVRDIDGAGNSNVLIEYSTVDNNPIIGKSYYRLKQTDFDGKFTYSNIVFIDNNESINTSEMIVYPNPVSSILNVRLTGFIAYSDVLISIQNMSGRRVLSYGFSVDGDGNALVKVNDIKGLSKGIYIVNCVSNTKLVTKKLIVN